VDQVLAADEQKERRPLAGARLNRRTDTDEFFGVIDVETSFRSTPRTSLV
jgi:hypothetical protein